MRLPHVLAITVPLACAGTARLAGQAPDSMRADTSRADSAQADTVMRPAVPTPEQQRYLDGLRTAGRGIAQLKTGLGRLDRARAGRDTVERRRAAQTLGGLCMSARDFMSRGRAQMQPMVYADTARIKARRLAVQLDSLISFMTPCRENARRTPDETSTTLAARIRNYEAALKDFRTAVGLPNRS